MNVSIKGFIYHKTSEGFLDCFDRFAINTQNDKFAVSDGVSKSFFPGIWAELLVDSFVNVKGKVNLTDAELLRSIQHQWFKKVEEIVHKPNQKFFVQNLFAQGKSAAATFVGLHFFLSDGKYYWKAFALGDSFLFFVPEQTKDISKNFKDVIYLSSKEDFEFDNYPDFFDSRSKISKGKIHHEEDDLCAGTFYMMTDALSQWFVTEKQAAVDEIENWTTQAIFENRIRVLREGQLQNDDVAILVINLIDDNDNKINYGDVLLTDLARLQEPELIKFEKDEAEWAQIEDDLRKKYEAEKLQAKKTLIEKHKYEKENYKKELTLYIEKKRDEDRIRLKRKHAEEWEKFDRDWERRFDAEKVQMEEQLFRKQENELLDLENKISDSFEKARREQRKILDRKSLSSEDEKGKDEPMKPKATSESGKIENQKKNELNKKKGLWESTIEFGVEAYDTISNFISKKDQEQGKHFEKLDKSKYRREIKITEGDPNAKKKGADDNDKDVSSITDKF